MVQEQEASTPQSPLKPPLQIPEEGFGSFNGRHGYGATIPSDTSLNRLFMKLDEEEIKEIERAIGCVDGEFGSVDDTFASMHFSKGTRGAKLFDTCRDMMNEVGKVTMMPLLHLPVP